MVQYANTLSRLITVSCVVALMVFPISLIYFTNYQFAQFIKTSSPNPTVTGDEATRITTLVARAEKIPKDEIPTVVLVTDTTTLASFGQIRLGDYILLYHQANLAIVFDDISKRIINAVTVNIKNNNIK